MAAKILLLGNSNTGKTSLFNAITKSYLKTGNYFGVTVGAWQKTVKIDGIAVEFSDLPGAVSLRGARAEQIVTREAVLSGEFDGIIYVCSAMSLARNLYMLCELKSLGIKNITVAINMCDEAQRKGVIIDCGLLSRHFGYTFLQTSAKKNTNIISLIREVLKNINTPPRTDGTALKVSADTIERRYKDIDYILGKAVKQPERDKSLGKLEKLTLHKRWGIVAFAAVMSAVFLIVFFLVGTPGSDYLSDAAQKVNLALSEFLIKSKIPDWTASLLCNGILDGAISIIKFLPQIILLYLLLAFLEDVGYLSRAAYVTDNAMMRLGLCGRSAYTLILGLGCTAAAAPTARAIEQNDIKTRTVLLTPFISCSAKLPVYSVIAAVFFKEFAAPVIIFIYIAGLLSFFFAAKVLKRAGKDYASILEIPPYRMPSAKRIITLTGRNCGQFLARVSALVLTVNIFVWLASHYGPSGQFLSDGQGSFLHIFTMLITPVFQPLGITDWRAVSALISGLFAKEAIISSMSAFGGLQSVLFSSRQAAVFLSFVLFYTPCFAALASMSKEIGFKKTVISAAVHLALAYFAALIVNFLWGFFAQATAFEIIVFIMSVVFIAAAYFISSQKDLKNEAATDPP